MAMINHFLASLDNSPIAPGDIYWPSFTTRTVAAHTQWLRDKFIGVGLQRRHNFFRCVQLLWVVEESSLADRITNYDTRITYDRASLQGLVQQRGTVSVLTSGATTAVANLQVHGAMEFGEWTVGVSGTTLTISDPTGASVASTISWTSGSTGAVAVPGGGGAITLSGGPTTVGTWHIIRYAPAVPWVQTCLANVSDSSIRVALPTDLLAHYDATPFTVEKLAAVVCSLI